MPRSLRTFLSIQLDLVRVASIVAMILVGFAMDYDYQVSIARQDRESIGHATSTSTSIRSKEINRCARDMVLR
jgi:hypothetical protein